MPSERIVYVDPDATGAADGTSLADAYTQLATAVTAEESDLIAADEVLAFECHSSAGSADTGTVPTISSAYNTDSTRYVHIRPYTGNEAGTTWNASIYRLESSVLAAGGTNRDVLIDNIQFDAVLAGSQGFINWGYGGSAYRELRRCYIRYSGTGGSGNWAVTYSTNTGALMSNNIFDGWVHAAIYNTRSGGLSYIYDNTFIDCVNNVQFSTADLATLKGNLSSGSTNDYVGTYAAGTDYNSTDNASNGYTVTGGGNTNDRVSQTFTFAGASDYALNVSDAGAYQHGVDLASDINYSVVGHIGTGLRVPLTSIGAHDPDGSGSLLTIDTEPSTVVRGETGVILGVSGGGLGATQGSGSVTLGGESCAVTSWSDTSVTITASSTLALKYDLVGYAFKVIADDNSTGVSSLVTLTPPAGYAYIDQTNPLTVEGTVWQGYAGTAPSTGDQCEYEETVNTIDLEVDLQGYWTLSTTPTQNTTYQFRRIDADGSLDVFDDLIFSVTTSGSGIIKDMITDVVSDIIVDIIN